MKLAHVFAFIILFCGQHMVAYEQKMYVQFDDLYPKTQFQKTFDLCIRLIAVQRKQGSISHDCMHNVMAEYQKIDTTTVLPDDLAYLAKLIAILYYKDL